MRALSRTDEVVAALGALKVDRTRFDPHSQPVVSKRILRPAVVDQPTLPSTPHQTNHPPRNRRHYAFVFAFAFAAATVRGYRLRCRRRSRNVVGTGWLAVV